MMYTNEDELTRLFSRFLELIRIDYLYSYIDIVKYKYIIITFTIVCCIIVKIVNILYRWVFSESWISTPSNLLILASSAGENEK